MTSSAAPFAGTERFALLRELGAGGMGVVYEAHDRDLDMRVALKLLPHIDAASLFNFKREFRSLAALVHPNLVALHELISDGHAWFFTMEAIDGVDLLTYLRPPGASACDLAKLRRVLPPLVAGIQALHGAGVLHRDLKPSNVLVRRDGTPVILDFGLVLELAEPVEADGATAGTLAYMSPEQAMHESLGPASDWYALGVMLYEALTGVLPTSGSALQWLAQKMTGAFPPPSALVAGLPPALGALCQALLHPDPEQRPGVAAIVEQMGELWGAAPSEDYRAPAGRALPFVGREALLAALDEAADRVRDGRPQTVLLHGRSGAGKSALAQRFLRRLQSSGEVVVLAGRCYEQESVPYKALDSLIDALTHVLLRLAPDERLALLPAHTPELARMFPVLGRVPEVAMAPAGRARAPDPGEQRRRAVGALRDLLEALSRRREVVLFIDDLQWGDVESANVLLELLQPGAAPCLLFLAAYRSEDADESPCLRALQARWPPAAEQRRLEVPSLAPAEADALATALLADSDAGTAADAGRIARESDGDPYFILELVQQLRDHSDGTGGGPGAAAVSSGAAGDELRRALWRRVERLAPDARAFMELLAVAGRPIRVREVFRTLGDARIDLSLIAGLRAEHLVRGAGTGVGDMIEVFHDRLRETVRDALDDGRRRELHLRLATTLEEAASGRIRPTLDPRPREPVDVDWEFVASHFELAGETERAGAHYANAAFGAAKALAFERAARLFRASLALRPRLGPLEASRLRAELGHALANAGRGLEAAEAFEAALGGATDGSVDELMRLAATQYCISGHIDRGRAMFGRAMRRAGLRMPRRAVARIAGLLAGRGWLRVRGLRPAREVSTDRDTLARIDLLWSVSAALSAVDVVGVASMQTFGLLRALRSGEPRRIVRSLAWEAVLTGTGGQRAEPRAHELLERARTLLGRDGTPETVGMLHLATGWIAFLNGRHRQALAECDVAEVIFREQCTGVWWELGMARTMIGWDLVHCGELDELRRRMAIYYEDARRRGDLFLVTNLGAVAMPLLCVADDDLAAAHEHLRAAEARWPDEGFTIQHVSVLFSRIMLHLYGDEGGTAYDEMRRQWGPLRWSLQMLNQYTRITMYDLRARSALAAMATRPAHARRALLREAERAAERIAAEGADWAEPVALRLRAGVAMQRGDDAAAAELLRGAATAFDRQGMRLHGATAWRRLGEVLGGEEGAGIRATADGAMRALGVRDVARLTRAYAPPAAG